MPNLTTLIALTIDAADRASDTWERICEQPVSVTLIRNGTALTAQTCRIEYDTTKDGAGVISEAGQSSQQWVIVYGVSGHPSVTDMDIARNDLFAYDGQRFRVVSLIKVPGEVQARAEALA